MEAGRSSPTREEGGDGADVDTVGRNESERALCPPDRSVIEFTARAHALQSSCWLRTTVAQALRSVAHRHPPLKWLV